ncbi:uncharacterized protein LOC129752395 [Uranotaenia lowii]|uniref:uncharacterized protein LOC129752395 n=1 Tax=Uranotaenia lowii TaxID=190385 RepID=UPI00247AEEA0|nr:uncharacterized protein LOC129752395 [Uranotaenia lowii]
MESIFEQLSSNIKLLVYADDILVIAWGQDHTLIRSRLQEAMNTIHRWAVTTGFSLSPSKSQLLHVCRKYKHYSVPRLQINGTLIEEVNVAKILGVTVDRRLRFSAHARACRKALESTQNLFQIMGSRLIGGNRRSLMRIHQSLTIPKLFYGIGFISIGSEQFIRKLRPAYNSIVRSITGAFRTSPINSIYAESGMLPFEYLYVQQLTKCAILRQQRVTIEDSNKTLTIIQRANSQLRNLTNEQIPYIEPITRHGPRQWNAKTIKVDWKLKLKLRSGANSMQAIPLFTEHINREYSNHLHIYTDGSIADNRVGCGIWSSNIQKLMRLRPECSIFSAETYSILNAIKSVNDIDSPLVIFTDSASAITAVQNGSSKHPWIQSIETAGQFKNITLCWIPGHTGITGNELADHLANEARAMPSIAQGVPAQDAIRNLKHIIRQSWESVWTSHNQPFLRQIKCNTYAWNDRKQRQETRALCRLRIGHTRLTHSGLFLRNRELCDTCNTLLTVPHILLECRKYNSIRTTCEIQGDISEVLSNNEQRESKLIEYLKQTKLLHQL